MEQVYPTNIFKDPTEIAAISDVRNEGTNKCLDTLGHGRYSTLTTHTTVLSIHPFFFKKIIVPPTPLSLSAALSAVRLMLRKVAHSRP